MLLASSSERNIACKTYPAIIVLVKKTDDSTSTEFELIIHGRLEVKLDTVNIGGRSSRCWVR